MLSIGEPPVRISSIRVLTKQLQTRRRALTSLLFGMRSLLHLSPRDFQPAIPARIYVSSRHSVSHRYRLTDSLERPPLSLVHKVTRLLVTGHQEETPANPQGSADHRVSYPYPDDEYGLPSSSSRVEHRQETGMFDLSELRKDGFEFAPIRSSISEPPPCAVRAPWSDMLTGSYLKAN